MKNNHLLLMAFIFVILPVMPLRGQEVKKIAILETVDREDAVSYGIKLMVRSSLSYAITNTPGYEGYDRVDMASIVGEHDFQRTGMVSESQIRQLGQMTGASYILVAETAMIGASNIFITAKILNVETAKLERMASAQSGIKAGEIEEKCEELAESLFGDADASGNSGTSGGRKGLSERKRLSAEEKAEILREKEELKREKEERRDLRWNELMSKKVWYEGLVSFTLGLAPGFASDTYVGHSPGCFTSHGIRFVKPRIVVGVSAGYEAFMMQFDTANSFFVGFFPKWYFSDNGKMDAYIACHVGYLSIGECFGDDYLPYSGFKAIPEIGLGFKDRGKVAFDLSLKGHIYKSDSATWFYPNLCFGIRF